jgi:hypothetical protein
MVGRRVFIRYKHQHSVFGQRNFGETRPGLPSALGVGESQAPVVESDSAAAGDSALSMAEPVVARIRDAVTGEIDLFFGTNSVTTRDPELVARLLRAAR